MTFLAIIPARYASSRFPAKPLALLDGKPIIQRVYERVVQVFPCTCVATDDERILKVVEGFGGKAVMTSPNHKSGTDRCFEAYQKMGADADIVVNVQGDEPFIAPLQLQTIMQLFADPLTCIATLAKPFGASASLEEIENPNSPKVVVDNKGDALYFSRSVIPFLRGVPKEEWPHRHTFLKHIGLYAYKYEILQTIVSLPQAPLELCESLEQLRWLSAGLPIKVGLTDIETIGIDTPADLARAEQFLKQFKT